MDKQIQEEKITKTEKEWKEILTPDQYRICRQKGTERPFSGKYYHSKEEGIYQCVCCGENLFSAENKYDSGSGWPSFFDALDKDKIHFETDNSLGMIRVEISCKKCGSHLGHLFDDGPNPTGKRYCINSVALDLEKKGERLEK